jgi:hypothetical protein
MHPCGAGRFETKRNDGQKMAGPSGVYSDSMRDMSDFRFLSVLLLKLLMGSSSSEGHGGRTSIGSRSLAPRGCILLARFMAAELLFMAGTGGANSGVGPQADSL